jgi:tRNA (cytidine/uridine-2'-O-)-methyltransferase
MHVVLYQPQIPQNCGNIVRTCAVTGTHLILVRPLGFSTNSRWLKRAGLDYWTGVQVDMVDDLAEVVNRAQGHCTFLSSKVPFAYDRVAFTPDHYLIFGSETAGLPEEYHRSHADKFAKVPMLPGQRCLNLATTVGIVVCEGYRQQGWPKFQ